MELIVDVVDMFVYPAGEEVMNALFYFAFKTILEEVSSPEIIEVVTYTLTRAKSDRETFLSEMSKVLEQHLLSELVSDIATVLLMDYIDTVNIGKELQALFSRIVDDIKIPPKLSTIVVQSDMALLPGHITSTADESGWVDEESTVESSIFHSSVADEKEDPFLVNTRPHRDEKVTVPPFESCMKGYYVSYSIDGREINEIFGKVVAIDESKQLICISISDPSSYPLSPTSPSNHNRIWVSYHHPFLIWYRSNRNPTNSPRVSSTQHLTFVRAPKSISKAIGYKVSIKSNAVGHATDPCARGRVTAIDSASNLLFVSLHSEARSSEFKNDAPSSFPWRSPLVNWIGLPRPTTLAGMRLLFFVTVASIC
jgi:hypothetical protein